MDLLYTRCCGIDAHKHFVVACLSIKEGGESRKEVRRFGTMSPRHTQRDRSKQGVMINK